MHHFFMPGARAAILLGLVLGAGSAHAQTIYRCGNEYTRVPCANGRPLEAGDNRSAAQRAEARVLIAQERQLAREMEGARRRDEAHIKPAVAGSFGPAPLPGAAASAAKKQTPKKKRKVPAANDRDFLAGVPPVVPARTSKP